MQDDDAAPDPDLKPEGEDGVLRAMGRAFGMLAAGVEAIPAPVEQLAKDRQHHLQASIEALSDVAKLPSDQKLSAASNVIYEEGETAIKDFGAAAFKAMTCVEAATRRGFRKRPDQSEGENPFAADQTPSDGWSFEDAIAKYSQMTAGYLDGLETEVRPQQRHFVSN
jgi:hypothetical protein